MTTPEQFKREKRYVVLKNTDIVRCLTTSERLALAHIELKLLEYRHREGKFPLTCVVVESDWPEYKPTWDAIEVRMLGNPQGALA